MFKNLSLESRTIQTQNCAPIQCTVWPRNDLSSQFLKFIHEAEWWDPANIFALAFVLIRISSIYIIMRDVFSFSRFQCFEKSFVS